MALTGTYDRSLDEKRRMAIPKRLLDDFGIENLTSLYIAPGTEKSLAIYSPEGFDRLARKIARKGTNQGGRARLCPSILLACGTRGN